ncbi:type II secretion system protein E [Clostridium sp. CAG:967]|nr:type II secretion system protein E [Clostridium sp. CAG:967]
MLQSSKLSSRFKKSENELQSNEPKRFVLEKTVQVQPDLEETSLDENLETELKKALLQKIEAIPVWFEYTPDRQKELIKTFVLNRLSAEGKTVSDNEADLLIEKLFTSVMGFGPLDYLIVQDNVSAIYVNGTNGVFIEISGKVLNTEMKLNDKQMNFILKNISNLADVKPDTKDFIWNLKVRDMNISVILPPVSVNGANIIIKKAHSTDINSLLDKGLLNRELFDFLVSAIDSGKNIVISGDINSGKTALLDTLVSSSLTNKRTVLLEDVPQMSFRSDNITKFAVNTLSGDLNILLTNILSMSPEHFIVDINTPVSWISDYKGTVITLRAGSVDAALTKLVSSMIAEEKFTEKYAKGKVLSDYDYIVQINKMSDGVSRITSVVELTPARTAALSVREIAKLVDNQYVTEIPQPLTSLRAESLISQAGSMASRFVQVED